MNYFGFFSSEDGDRASGSRESQIPCWLGGGRSVKWGGSVGSFHVPMYVNGGAERCYRRIGGAVGERYVFRAYLYYFRAKVRYQYECSANYMFGGGGGEECVDGTRWRCFMYNRFFG